MPRYVFVVLTTPLEGREDEYNDWYTKQHLADVLRVPGVESARRLRFVGKTSGEAPLSPYLALYDLKTDDIEAWQKTLMSRVGTDEMPLSPAMNSSKTNAQIFELFAEQPSV